MVTRRHHPQPLTPDAQFWQQAFVAAELTVLLKGRRMASQGLAHLAADYADQALAEFHRRFPS